MKILGVDPGTWRTGVGFIEASSNSYKLIYSQTITLRESLPISERLLTIYQNLLSLIEKFKPEALALENIFYSKNIRSMLKIGEARACAMLAAAAKSIPVAEYPPATVKQAVTGNGRASKEQIQAMVKTLLGLKTSLPPDSADALAVAICHAHQRRNFRLDSILKKGNKNFLAAVA